MVRLLATALVLAMSLGCSIMEELDKGSAEMDKHSPAARALKEKKVKAEAEKQEKAGSSKVAGVTSQARDAASKWWSNARSLAPDETDKDVVRCVLNGTDQYMATHDCAMRGGSVAKKSGDGLK